MTGPLFTNFGLGLYRIWQGNVYCCRGISNVRRLVAHWTSGVLCLSEETRKWTHFLDFEKSESEAVSCAGVSNHQPFGPDECFWCERELFVINFYRETCENYRLFFLCCSCQLLKPTFNKKKTWHFLFGIWVRVVSGMKYSDMFSFLSFFLQNSLFFILLFSACVLHSLFWSVFLNWSGLNNLPWQRLTKKSFDPLGEPKKSHRIVDSGAA